MKKTIMLFLLTLCAAAMFSFHSSALDAETDEYKDSGAVPAGAVYPQKHFGVRSAYGGDAADAVTGGGR